MQESVADTRPHESTPQTTESIILHNKSRDNLMPASDSVN